MEDKREKRLEYPDILSKLSLLEIKMENSEKIHKLELEVNSILLYVRNDQAKYDRLFEDQNKLLEKMDLIIFGRDGKNGALTDIDRLKEDSVSHKKERDDQIKWLWGVISTVIGAMVVLWITTLIKR